MSIMHNCILRGANAIYNQAGNMSGGTARDVADFTHFAYQWSLFVKDHHDAEEEIIFPEMNKKAGVEGLMDANVAEHRIFHDGLVRYMGYLEDVMHQRERYDETALVGIMDGFMPALHGHLQREIDYLVRLEEYDDRCDWRAWFEGMMGGFMRENMKDGEYRREKAPMFFVLHDKSFADGVWGDFPPTPRLVAVVMRMLFLSKHQAWWRFSGCDLSSRPQKLPFA
ncbi:hypothetical protein QQS21_000667 [Conoideocrella luteorostrata]|uniref:Hemerythrin-like domain-containing protein n=1 Tax=Conoideocrella luteorostrata TaxID=1105319 RepID=A0AAJ0D118_9HYPO|nr:hypothetical protein QQS21_000667 [Conoideocrella luteorostrata]